MIINLKKAGCSCKVKTESNTKIGNIAIDKDKLYKSFTDFKNIANIKILKCYKLIFKLDAFKSNYANIVLLVIIFLFFISLIVFYSRDYYYLMKILNLIIFFKLNPQLIKIYLQRKKKKEQKKIVKKLIKIIKKIKKRDNLLNKLLKKDKKRKSISNVENEFMRVKVKHNLKKNKNKSNPSKRNKRIKRSKSYNINANEINSINKKRTGDLLNRLSTIPTKDGKQKIIYERKDLIGKLNDKELYKMFLKRNEYSHIELNELPYKKAIKNDKRTYWEYYKSLILTKHPLFFSFLPAFDYNSYTIKIFLFFFSFALNFAVNALFFNDATMHQICEDKGSFNFIYHIPQILLSSLISGIIDTFIQFLALTNSTLIDVKEKGNKQNIDVMFNGAKSNIKIKTAFFFVISFILLGFFWFYLGCFCFVYKNTQIHLIKDTVISLASSMIYPFAIYLLPGIFRLTALKNKKKDKELMYKFSKVFHI